MNFVAYLSLACWGVFELGLRVRDAVRRKGRGEHDRATRILIGLGIGATIVIAIRAADAGQPLPLAARVVGVVVLWLGLALRVWAVVTLGSAFRTTVEVDPDQTVVSSGPYRRIRHPSYTGLLLVLAGFGLAMGAWLSIVACLLLPLPAIVWRIHVEEAELTSVLGEPYRAYAATTRRLIPGLW